MTDFNFETRVSTYCTFRHLPIGLYLVNKTFGIFIFECTLWCLGVKNKWKCMNIERLVFVVRIRRFGRGAFRNVFYTWLKGLRYQTMFTGITVYNYLEPNCTDVISCYTCVTCTRDYAYTLMKIKSIKTSKKKHHIR